MTTIQKSGNLVPFIFVGCWNRNDTPRNNVTDSIRRNKIKNVVLGGDNVYPNKNGKPHSNTFKSRLKILFDGIYRLRGKKIYTALGNHDVDDMLHVQLNIKEWIIPDRYYCVDFKDYSLVVIDSNITNKDMPEWLLQKVNELRNANKKYFYVQHHPFITCQHKVKKVEQYVLPLLDILSTYPPISILCAHCHNYQNGTLHVNGVTIQQFIVGTGGGNLHSAISTQTSNIMYTVNEYIESYGYLEVTLGKYRFIKI